uniref:Uncharacterized protein n=1 Tax=Arundo donax TaxID=35708 RepID=A0A0A9AQT8_ARUDO
MQALQKVLREELEVCPSKVTCEPMTCTDVLKTECARQ